MTFLTTVNPKHFHTEIPAKPMGKYAHFVTIRVTESYPLFQTDGELNRARVHAGMKKDDPESRKIISRLAMFKRKQSSPERLTGRELLRSYQIGDWENCEYNVNFSKTTPDCILYGFAIGDAGSEKSKVVVDTAYSITAFDDSHENFTLNAPYENGTMSSKGEKRADGSLDTKIGETTSRINSQDHIVPQVFFPSIVTLKDPTEAGFLYVLNNILRTRHYGAQTTRTGRVRNELIGVIFADGEIVSNLRWTQKIYDLMAERNEIQPPDPLNEDRVRVAAEDAISELMSEECIPHTDVMGDDLDALLSEVKAITSDEVQLKAMLTQANAESVAYAQKYIFKPTADKGKKTGKKSVTTAAE